MTLSEERISTMRKAANRKPTKREAQENLIKCGILTKKGNVRKPYDKVFVKK